PHEKVLVVIGGGAAGIFGAIRAKNIVPQLKVVVIEKGKPLTKVRISGGGRCNVTNGHFLDTLFLADHYPRGNRELRGSFFKTHGPLDTISWFTNHGVQLKTEDDGRVFPVSDNSATIVDCLLGEARRNGVILEIGKVASCVTHNTNRQFEIEIGKETNGLNQTIQADYLLIATGSCRQGHVLAAQLGHTIVEPRPNIPFNAARSSYYQSMFDSIVATGKGFKGLSMHDLRGSLLKKEVASIDEYLKGCKVSWAKTRCTIMLEGWSDGKNCTIINFLASCPQGTMFLKSVDASDRVKDANLLFELLDEIVLEVGVENVVQIITDNASNYVLAAGYFLNLKYHYKAHLGEDQTGEVKDGLYECLERMVPDEMQQLEVHRLINFFSRATGTFGKNLAKIARDVDQPAPPRPPMSRDTVGTSRTRGTPRPSANTVVADVPEDLDEFESEPEVGDDIDEDDLEDPISSSDAKFDD
ncbi:hypothetical protein KI387_029527, partial [Taxus chinensis]